MEYQTRPKGRPDEKDRRTTAAVRRERMAATRPPNALARSLTSVVEAPAMILWAPDGRARPCSRDDPAT